MSEALADRRDLSEGGRRHGVTLTAERITTMTRCLRHFGVCVCGARQPCERSRSTAMCEVPHLPSTSFRTEDKHARRSTRTAVGTMLLTDTGGSGKPETRRLELRRPYLPVCLGLLAWGHYHSAPLTLRSLPIWMISDMITLSKMDEGF